MRSHPTTNGEFTILGRLADGHSVPAEVLVKALHGLQQTVLLVAASQCGREVEQRFKPPRDFRERYTLRCYAARANCYTQPFTLMDERPQLDVMDTIQDADVLPTVYELLRRVADEDEAGVNELLPEPQLRTRAYRELVNYLPPSGGAWTLGFSVSGRPRLELRPSHSRVVREWLSRPRPMSEVMTVTGYLVKADYERQKVIIKYPPTGKEIDCFYQADWEDHLLESRRELVQVTGEFTLGPDGHPQRLTEVSLIQPLDLRPLRFDELEHGDAVFAFERPLVLNPTVDDSCQLLVVEDRELELHEYATTRDELELELAAHIDLLWREYAEENPENLTPRARRLRDTLRSLITRRAQ